MIQLPLEERGRIASLFTGWDETPIWSYLDGYMGLGWADRLDSPASARIIVGDFCFLSGRPDPLLLGTLPYLPKSGLLIIPRETHWLPLIMEAYPGHWTRTTRYAFKKNTVFDHTHLWKLARDLPSGYELEPISHDLYQLALQSEWSRDLCSQFPTFESYQLTGLGFAALYQGELAAGASSYSCYASGIEIEVDTNLRHRRRGLARACASRLILACLERGLYPSWDAANLPSTALAEQLGYQLNHPYDTYLITP